MILNLEGIPNVRELGGYIMKDGREVKHNLLFRGGLLRKAAPESLARMSGEFDIRINFDFRTEGEKNFAPDPDIPGVEYLWLPTLDPFEGNKTNNVFSAKKCHSAEELVLMHAGDPDVQEAAKDMYTDIVTNEYSQLQYAVFLKRIGSMKEGAVYWHCSQGKDRTGLGAAFILAALGADRETILYDYNISAEAYREEEKAIAAQILANGGGEKELDVVKTFISVNTAHFITALDLIDSEFGGMDNYLKEYLLVSDEEKEVLRNRYLGRSQGTGF